MTTRGEPVETSRQDGVLIVRLARPHRRNAVDRAANDAVIAALATLDDDPDLRVGILTGVGGTFCAGMDLKAFVTEGLPARHSWGFLGLEHHRFRKPIIAAVEGYALAGGFEAALACDLIVAARDAQFGLSEVRRGMAALGGGLVTLPRKIPENIAMELALTGATIGAERAHALGLVNRLCANGEALDVARSLAGEIAANSPLGVEVSKAVIQGQHDWTREEAADRQQALGGHLVDTEDAREGAIAFAERRPPRWKGR